MQILKEEIKNNIEKAAKELFLQDGFDRTSMKSIAKKAGISKSYLYNYFGGKEEIFYHITGVAYNQLTSMLDTFIQHEEFEFENSFDLEGYCDFLSTKIVKCFKEYKEEILMILDCSQGTMYEDTKTFIIDKLGRHLKEEFDAHSKYSEKERFVIPHVISSGLIEGIIQILRYPNTDMSFIRDNIKLLVEHYIYGYAHVLNIW